MALGDGRPGPVAAAWTASVLAEHAQAERLRAGETQPDDYWKPFAHRFAPTKNDGGGTDPGLEAILRLVRPADTVLDVGAGGGRIAIPVAQKCKAVVAVEPSESMRGRMQEQAAKWGVRNVEISASTWEDAEVAKADVVICAHVMYTVRDPVRFIRKLESHARRVVAVIVFDQPAVSQYFPLWPLVHGEERMRLPCMAELEQLLVELRIVHDKEELPAREARGFENADMAVAESMARLFVAPGTPKAAKLDSAVRAALEPHGAGVRFKWSQPQRPWLVTWKPSTR